MSRDLELVCIACERQTRFSSLIAAEGRFASPSVAMSEEKRLPFVGYGVHGGYLYLLQLMSELLTRFYWVSSESLWQKFLNRIAFMITKRKAEFRTMRQRPREEWIQNYRLWPKSAQQNLYTRTWLLTVSFKCYLYYDTETSVRPGLIETVLIRASKTG